MPQYCYKCMKVALGGRIPVAFKEEFSAADEQEAVKKTLELHQQVHDEGFWVYDEQLWDLSGHHPRQVLLPRTT